MGSSILPMTLGDMLDKTVRIIGRTFWRNLAIAITFLIAPVVLLYMAANHFYSSTSFGSQLPAKDPIALVPMLLHGFYFGAANLLLSAAALFAEIAIIIVIGGEMNSEKISYGDAIRMTFNRRWINGIGEGVLKILIFVGAGILMAIFIGVSAISAAKTPGGVSGLGILFTVLSSIALACIMIYLVLRLFFALTAVAVENLGPIEAFKKSWFLVGGHWWRTAGILIVFGLLSGIAISAVSAPIMFGSMWGEYKELFTVMGQTHGKIDPRYFDNFRMGMGRMVGIWSGVTTVLSLLLTPAFTVVMYFDLRARQDDLPAAQQDSDNGDVPLVTF